MKPYYSKDGITLYCADMRDVDLPPARLVLTDPPFAKETHTGARTNPIGGNHGASDWATGGNEGQPLIDFDSVTADELHAMFDRLVPVTQLWLISFMDYHHIHHFESATPKGLRFVRFGIWHKTNGAPQFTGDRPLCGALQSPPIRSMGGRMRWNGGGKSSVYVEPKINGNHRTAKPPRLIERLMRDFSNPGDLVLDPFAGGGVVLHVAKMLKRQAVGVEMDEQRCEGIVQWLERGTPLHIPRKGSAEPTLFDMAEAFV